MAGIQLTGADMSGAMPTATVEAQTHNVPVFIDEYLQPSTSTTVTTTAAVAAAATRISDSQTINSNSSNCSSNCNYGDYNNTLAQVLNIDDNNKTLEDFDFNMDFLLDDDENELGSFINYDDDCCNANNINIINNNNNNNQFDILDSNFDSPESLLGPEHEIATDFSSFVGIDISAVPEPSLQSMVANPNCMLSSAAVHTNSQVNSQLFGSGDWGEPTVPDLDNTLLEMECDDDIKPLCFNELELLGATAGRDATRMEEKRMKLIPLKVLPQPYNSQQDIDTPSIVKNISEMEERMNFNPSYASNVETIRQNLIDETSNGSSHFEFAPFTPQSHISSHTVYTNPTTTDYNTSPNSPALSTTSTTAYGNRKKRGRPCKELCDSPDPEQLSRLTSEAERKRLRDRYKNNVASQLSRRKNKQREEAEIEEERISQLKNTELKCELYRVSKIEKKLKRALKLRITQGDLFE